MTCRLVAKNVGGMPSSSFFKYLFIYLFIGGGALRNERDKRPTVQGSSTFSHPTPEERTTGKGCRCSLPKPRETGESNSIPEGDVSCCVLNYSRPAEMLPQS